MPKITIGRYASFSCPSLDSLRMEPPENSGGGGAVEKRFNCLMCLCGLSGAQTESFGWR